VNGMRNGSVRSFFPPSAVPSHAVSLRRRYGPSFVSHVPLSDRSCRRRMVMRSERTLLSYDPPLNHLQWPPSVSAIL